VEHVRDTRNGTTVLTDQRDIYENNANMGARRLREMIFGVLPGWFTEDAIAACYKTLTDDVAEGTLAERIAMAIDGFGTMGVLAGQLEQKLGAPQSKWTAYDLAQLTVIYRSLKRGEVRVEDEFPAARAATVTAAEITSQPSGVGAPAAGTNGTPAPVGTKPPVTPPASAQAPADATPGTNAPWSVTTGQTTALWAVASTKLGFGKDDKAQWRQACEKLIGRKLDGGTVGSLSADEADALLQQLGSLDDRDQLIALLAQMPGDAQ
jgi:hypothetical protein